jgi:hypothetical protein
MRQFLSVALLGLLAASSARAASAPAGEAPAAKEGPAPKSGGETVEQALCRLIEASARTRRLPVSFFTRLIFRESAFRVGAVSPVGAQGVAQFMPGTARERGLADPFDPEQAIPAAAHLLADHRAQFGNLGLAAAAYNGGPARVTAYLAGTGGLPAETRAYVAAITGRTADDWAAEAKTRDAARDTAKDAGKTKDEPKETKAEAKAETMPAAPPEQTCLQVTASLRIPGRAAALGITGDFAPLAPWGVQLAGGFSKPAALAAFDRARNTYARAIGEVRPMVIGTRLLSRGTRAFYRIRIPAQSRKAADALCARIRSVGGACAVLRS